MITLDLFEQEQPKEPQRDPVPDPRMATDTKTRQLALLIYNQMIKAYKSGVPIATLEYPDPGTPAVTLSRNQLYTFLLHWAAAQQKGGKKKEDFIKLFGNRSAMLDYIGRIKKIQKAPAPQAIPEPEGILPGEEGPVQAVQGRLFKEEKKSSEQSKYRDVAVQRAVRKAQADFPTAASDSEAFIKSVMVQQDQDQQNIDKLKTQYQRNRDLIKKNDELDRTQARNIDNIQQEIDQVEQDNNALARMIQSMSRANAELQSTLEKMRKKSTEPQAEPVPAVAAPVPAVAAPVPQPQLGVSVATDKIQQPQLPTPQPKRRVRRKSTPVGSTTVGGQPADVLTRRGGGQAPRQKVTRVDQEQPQLDLSKSDINVDRILSQQDIDDLGDFDFDIMGMLKGQKEKQPVGEVHDIPFGMTEDPSIPAKAVIQGYTVEYDPIKRIVAVSRKGQTVGRAVNKPGSHNNYMTLVNRIIDASEEDKYPDDLEARSVERPFGESAELNNLQLRHQRIANLASIKRKIEKLQARAERGGRILPRGLAADLEDYFTTTDVDTAYDDMMTKYQKQLAALEQYLGMRKVLWSPKKAVRENESSKAYEQGGREAYYGRPNNNPYEKGTKEYADYNRGYDHFKDEGKDYLRELDLDRSGQPMYQQEEVYMLTHDGREVAFYRLKDLKRAEQDAREMQRKLGGEVHIRKVMREGDQKPADDDIMGKLFKDFGEIFGKPPAQPKPQEPKDKPVKEGRAGYGPLLNQKHWEEVEKYLWDMINNRSLDDETRAAYKQRYLEKQREAKLKGFK